MNFIFVRAGSQTNTQYSRQWRDVLSSCQLTVIYASKSGEQQYQEFRLKTKCLIR